MRYISDHDYHIHSQLSLCSGHPEQTTANILKYGEDNGFKHICLTDHYWDENVPGATTGFYGTQNNAWIDKALPLPESDKCKFHFGVETDMNKHMVVGVSEKMMDRFEFIIVPTTHLHMMGFTLDESDSSHERRAYLYIERFAKLIEQDLPWHKVGLAHITCPLLNNTYDKAYIETLKAVDYKALKELFEKSAKIGLGIELNEYIENYEGEELEVHMNVYRIAKEAGCKFYFGSDAHTPDGLRKAPQRFEKFIDLLDLKEEDKFMPFK